MAAVVIAGLVNQVQCLSEFLLAQAICGANAGVDTTRGQQQSTVTAFNQGEVGSFCFTPVMCEGINEVPSLDYATLFILLFIS